MSAIDAITGTKDTQLPTTSGPAGTLGRDAFLQLLVTQLEHQNPLEPQADGEFLAQLAQFSSLEQLQTMSADISTLLTYVEAALATNNTGDTQGSN